MQSTSVPNHYATHTLRTNTSPTLREYERFSTKHRVSKKTIRTVRFVWSFCAHCLCARNRYYQIKIANSDWVNVHVNWMLKLTFQIWNSKNRISRFHFLLFSGRRQRIWMSIESNFIDQRMSWWWEKQKWLNGIKCRLASSIFHCGRALVTCKVQTCVFARLCSIERISKQEENKLREEKEEEKNYRRLISWHIHASWSQCSSAQSPIVYALCTSFGRRRFTGWVLTLPTA